ncbi:hypothetical protein C6P45_005433 [Maudiozyma exigua]|uniref:Zinc finger PHD-type domain-containing protein n=1 Tax=Maudiozyma exigua TaxID=34358 RepID=A0A9P6W9H7_MAUEX|nr:hypothetical protein C6P45_005433 [Kazachstania exigua]
MVTLPSWCPPYSSQRIDPITGVEIYCICKKPDEGELMVGCDGCDDWFHFKCLRVPVKYRHLVSSFFCTYFQAGISGPHKKDPSKPLPKTLWKRKCRIADCYEPCGENSKYCSQEHGLKYMRNLMNQCTNDTDKNLVKEMLNVSESSADIFNNIGRDSFIDDPVVPEVNTQLYEEIIGSNNSLKELEASQKECADVTIVNIQERIHVLDEYIDWIEEINNKINDTGNTDKGRDNSASTDKKAITKKRKRKGSPKRTTVKKKICGYISDWSSIPCTSEDFLSQYKENEDETITVINGVCSKLNCKKHSDWVSIDSDQLQQQLDTAESNNDRLNILIKVKKRQLHGQYYEQLAKLQVQGQVKHETASSV